MLRLSCQMHAALLNLVGKYIKWITPINPTDAIMVDNID